MAVFSAFIEGELLRGPISSQVDTLSRGSWAEAIMIAEVAHALAGGVGDGVPKLEDFLIQIVLLG